MRVEGLERDEKKKEKIEERRTREEIIGFTRFFITTQSNLSVAYLIGKWPNCCSSTSKPKEVKHLPGGKIKKKDKQEIIIEKVTRNKRKSITTIKGLELFGVKLSDASKKLGKKFATGASLVKGPTEKEQIDVQGDIGYDIVEFITKTWPDVC
uniref:Translation machinery-associated protein 22 n=1 Tax=Solanum tuberosum TaxID=4113 RepID=M1DRV8_SOLTU